MGTSRRASAEAQQSGGAFLGVRMDTVVGGRVRVTAVLPGSPAAQAGLVRGDFITAVGDQNVGAPRDVVSAVQSASIGQRLRMSIEHEGSARGMDVILGAAPRRGQIHQSFLGREAPGWRMSRADGSGAVELNSMRGRVVLVYFWSLWCGACRLATPELLRLQAAHSANGLEIVGVSDDDVAELRSSAAVRQLPFPILHDVESKVGSEYWISAVPTFFVIDQTGRIAFAMEGWDQARGRQMEAEIRRLLARRRP